VDTLQICSVGMGGLSARGGWSGGWASWASRWDVEMRRLESTFAL